MKTTLENSYCRPTTEAEWVKLKITNRNPKVMYDCVIYTRGETVEWTEKSCKMFGYTEIPVQNFIDLAEDKTYSLFRLIETGFHNSAFDYYDVVIPKEDKIWQITVAKNGKVTLNGEITNIANFTDLLTLIRFLK